MKRVIIVIIQCCILLCACSHTAVMDSSNNSTDISKNVSVVVEPKTNSHLQRDYWPTDGWKTSSPEKQGMDSGFLDKADKYIEDNYPGIHSLLVVRHGYLVFEKYYQGYDADTLQNIKCVSKSIISALVGIAINDGYIKSIDQCIEDFFPEYFNEKTEPLKKEIKIVDLLTLSAGFDWQENESVCFNWLSSNDRAKFLLDLPMQTSPGMQFNYNTALSHLLSIILTKTTKMSTKDFCDKVLFKPLGIRKEYWDKDYQGYYIGGCELSLTSRDTAKFGYLYLNNGYWNGRQIISNDWVQESTSKHIETFNAGNSYGYLWWINSVSGHSVYFGNGYGGQNVFVIPDLDMVVVTTATYSNIEAHFAPRSILEEYIIPSII